MCTRIRTHTHARAYKYICNHAGTFTVTDSLRIDAEENLGSSEIREAYLARAEYLSLIGAKETAVSALREAMEKTSSTGQRMDITFQLCRLGGCSHFSSVRLCVALPYLRPNQSLPVLEARVCRDAVRNALICASPLYSDKPTTVSLKIH